MAFHINPQTGNPNQCRAQKGNCPFGGAADHYESKAEARQAYEAKMGSGAKPSLQMVSHDKPEDMTTGKGNTYSKVTEQPNGSLVQTVNGHTIIIGKKDSSGAHKIFLSEEPIGWVEYDRAKKRWEITYPDSLSARPQKFPVDAMAALIKKRVPAPRKPSTEPTMAKGYNPGEQSELNYYDDFPTNKTMTVGRLRRLSNADLVRLYNRLEFSQHSAHYSSEIQSDEAARKRVEAVLAERGERLEVGRYGTLQPGEDHASANSYRLVEKKTPTVPCDEQHQARIARDGYCRKCGGAA